MENKTVQLSAIDPIVVNNIPSPDEIKVRTKKPIYWGKTNTYPNYLWDLYNSVATLQSIINGTVDFACGDDAQCTYFPSGVVNESGDTINTLLRKLLIDKLIFGGFAIEIIRSLDGRVKWLNHIDFMKLRSNDKNTEFYYSNDWNSWGAKYIEIPKFDPEHPAPRSIYYSKGNVTRSVYPIPLYGAAVIPCEIEKCINEFHLNNINNGFMSNVVISFNNGQPDEEQQREIERQINEKFGGFQNAGRILIAYNDSEDNRVTVERLDGDDFDKKYETLSKRSREQIFIAFRANPCLFGLNPENNGFSAVEFEAAFKLYNKTVISPIQKEIESAFNTIIGANSLIISPFIIKWEDDSINN